MNQSRHIRIGILVPSSNTALEPLTTSILASIPTSQNIGVTAHFSRFRVTTIGLSASALAQFSLDKILDAARLLADAEVDVIGWSGTSAGWLGFDSDVALCEKIEAATGITATTSVLALNELFGLVGVKRLGLVTPYTGDVQDAIVKNYAAIGIDVVSERHLSRTDNVNLAGLREDAFDPMIESVVSEGKGKEGVQAITTFCTNLRTAEMVERWEGEYGIPVFDTVTMVVWKCLKICDVDMREIEGWGKIMNL